MTLAPQPSLRHVRSLVRRTTAAGLPATLKYRGRRARAARRPRRHRLPRRPGRARRRARRRRRRPRRGPPALHRPTRSRSRPRRRRGERRAAADRHPRARHAPRRPLHRRPRRRSGGHVVRATLPLDGAPSPPRDEPATPPCELSQAPRPRPAPPATATAHRSSPPRSARARLPRASRRGDLGSTLAGGGSCSPPPAILEVACSSSDRARVAGRERRGLARLHAAARLAPARADPRARGRVRGGADDVARADARQDLFVPVRRHRSRSPTRPPRIATGRGLRRARADRRRAAGRRRDVRPARERRLRSSRR